MTGTQPILLIFQDILVDFLSFSKNMIIQSINSGDIFAFVALLYYVCHMGFPDSSVGKEFACNAGDPCSIPGLGRSPGEEIGYTFQYSRAFLVAQLVTNPPAAWETWVRSLGWEDTMEKRKATHSSILTWRIPWTIQCHGMAKSQI